MSKRSKNSGLWLIALLFGVIALLIGFAVYSTVNGSQLKTKVNKMETVVERQNESLLNLEKAMVKNDSAIGVYAITNRKFILDLRGDSVKVINKGVDSTLVDAPE